MNRWEENFTLKKEKGVESIIKNVENESHFTTLKSTLDS